LKRGDIYLVSLDPASGHEQQGTRPVLIVSPDIFNSVTNTQVIAPITTGGGFARKYGYAVPLTGAGLKTTGVVRCDQVRTVDLGARGARRLEAVPVEVVSEVLARVATLFQ
jgi:mRNA-degrading endonuclease toxin of MazEF toxin-antitoxin module